MKKILSLILFLQVLMVDASVPPNWIPVPNPQYNMNVIGKIQLSPGVFSLNENDIVGAFVGSECRGVASPFAALGGALFLTIGSGILSGEIVTFKIYLASANEIVNANETILFLNAGEVGTMANPFIFTISIPNNVSVQSVTVPTGQNKCYNALQSITVAGNGTSFLVQSGGSTTMVAGQNIHYYPGTVVALGGYLHAFIAPTGPFCTTPSLPSVTASGEEIDKPGTWSFRLYPNPTTANFTLQLGHDPSGSPVEIHIYNMMGNVILKRLILEGKHHEFSLETQPPGIYLVKVDQNGVGETRKIIKQ